MHRSICLRLAVVVGALALAAGAVRPACAQDEKTPAFAQVLPRDGQVLVTWAAVKDATGYTVSRRKVGEEIDKAVLVTAQPVKETSVVDTGLTNGTPLIYAVQAVFADGSKGDPAQAVGTPHAPILGRFQYYDIETLNPGSVTIENNVLTIRASGADIWDAQDGQTFLATPVAGDFTITMKLNENPIIADDEFSNFGKVGLQAKFSITPGAPYALAFASVERTPEYMFEGRRQPGGGGNWSGGIIDYDDAKFPAWFRLTRRGNVFSAEVSFDGTSFRKISPPGDQTMQNVPQELFVGIAATAHDPDLYIIGKIDATSVVITTP